MVFLDLGFSLLIARTLWLGTKARVGHPSSRRSCGFGCDKLLSVVYPSTVMCFCLPNRLSHIPDKYVPARASHRHGISSIAEDPLNSLLRPAVKCPASSDCGSVWGLTETTTCVLYPSPPYPPRDASPGPGRPADCALVPSDLRSELLSQEMHVPANQPPASHIRELQCTKR